MRCESWKLYIKLQSLMRQEEGQGLVEYALLLAIVTTTLVSLLGSIATEIVTIMATVANALANIC